MFIFKNKKIKDLEWFPKFGENDPKKSKNSEKRAKKPESAYYSDFDKHMVKHGYVPLGRSVTVPKKHDSFFAMLKSFMKERMKNKPVYHWCELIKLPCSPKAGFKIRGIFFRSEAERWSGNLA